MESKQITFPNGNTALAVILPKNVDYPEIIRALAIQRPKAVFVVIGGAKNLDDTLKATLSSLFSNGIAATATALDALIIDGGTKSGVMEMMGQGVAEQEHRSILLGVAPEGKVYFQSQPTDGASDSKTSLDPNHSHFALVNGDKWGDETATLFGIASELARHLPVVAVLAGGGDIAKEEVVQCVRRGWPVVVITGSGELADTLAEWWKQKSARPTFLQRILRKKKTAADKYIARIVEDGDLYLFSYKASSEELKALLKFLCLKQEKSVLAQIRERERLYALMADQYQTTFKRLQICILALGVLATALALGQTQLESLGWLKVNSFPDQLYHFFVIVVPILVTILLGIVTYFKWGEKWVFLRNSREVLKREIFLYRTHAERYTEPPAAPVHPGARKSNEQKLAERVKILSQQVMQTEVNMDAMIASTPQRLPGFGAADVDDGYSDLSPDDYIKFRLDDQRSYYRQRAVKWSRQLKIFQPLVIIATGVGAILAALKIELWLPLATALAASFALYLEYMQVVNTLTKYNQAATSLEDVKQWWTALPEPEKQLPGNFHKLVEATENVLESEHSSWVQNMQRALNKLYNKDSTNDDDE